MLYGIEVVAVSLAWLGLLSGIPWIEKFVAFMASRFDFVAVHMELGKFPKIISGFYWSLAILFLPVKSLLFLFAPFHFHLVGRVERERLQKESGGSVLGLAQYVARKGLQKWTRGWMIAVAGLLIFGFLYGLVFTLLPISIEDLSLERSRGWWHMKVMLWEYFFRLSPVSLAIAGSIFTYLQSAMLVAAVAIASTVWSLRHQRQG